MMSITVPNEWSSPAEWANAYRAEELCVVPAKPDEKRPALVEWREYQQNGIPSDTHNRWYTPRTGEHRNNPRMGFITGPANLDADSAMFVIDLDEKDGVSGKAAWQRLLDEHEGGIDFDTWRALTGTGGQHLYFRCPVDRCPRTQKHITLGIDVRGVGGFIMAPPSTRKEGTGSYDWVPRFSPWECDIAEAPEWLLAYLESLCGTGTAADMPEVTRAKSSLGLDTGKVEDGREGLATRMVYIAFVRLLADLKRPPTTEELFDDVWKVWERKVDTEAQGKDRGPEFIRLKCLYTIGRFTKGDLPQCKTVADAEAIVASGEASAAEDEFGPDAFGGAAQATTIKTVDFRTLLEEVVVEEPDYIEDGFLGPGNFALIAGPPKAQKSFLLQEMLVSCALGTSFLCGTFTVPRPLRVFYLQAEMNRKLLRKRARAMRFLSNEQREVLSRNLIVTERFHMILDANGVETTVRTIGEAFSDGPPDIIALDPLANLYDGDNENDNAQLMRFLVGRVEAVRQKVNPLAAVIMVHHATKAKAEDMARDPFVLIRGAGSLRGYYDSAIVIFRKNEESKARRVHFELRSGESPEPMDVELIDGRFGKAAEGRAEITMDVARQMQKAIDEAWNNGRPMSTKSQTRSEGRYAPRILNMAFGVDANAVADMLEQWLVNGVLTYDVCNRKTKEKGLRVAEWL